MLGVDLEREAIQEGNRNTAPHDGRALAPRSIHALQLPFSPDSTEPGQHDLVSAHSDHALLIDESSSVSRLLDARLDLQPAAGAGPPCIGRPVVSRLTIWHRVLPHD